MKGMESLPDFAKLTSVQKDELIHDGWKPHRDLVCKHALCNANLFHALTQTFQGNVPQPRSALATPLQAADSPRGLLNSYIAELCNCAIV